MTLFSDAPDDRATSREHESRDDRDSPAEKLRRRGWYFVIVAFVTTFLLAMTPAPYVIERPGPVFNTLGTDRAVGQQSNDKQSNGKQPKGAQSKGASDDSAKPQQLITISGHENYPAEGTLYLLTVSAFGTPSRLPSWSEVVGAWLSPREAVVPVDSVYPPDITIDQRNALSAQQMVDSQNDAIAAALEHLGIDPHARVTVAEVYSGGPAEGILRDDDTITALDGKPVEGLSSLRKLIAAHGTSTPAKVTVERGGSEKIVEVTPTESDSGPIVGIGVVADYSFPFAVTIKLNDVGGPSAGMMFALGIVDKLTPGSLTGGELIAGTGTIDGEGTVGGIGGIRQKMYAAVDAGATWFLAPKSNCNEVVGNIPDGLNVVAVKNLDEAVAAVTAIGANKAAASLPTCTRGS